MNHSAQRRAPARITTLDDLREHLQWAVELEHATLPPYLCALYSLDPERNPEAVELVAGVLIEEMLHLALAANLLNAVGGRPWLDTPRMLPPYPRRLPHGDRSLELSLLPFGTEALDMFLRLERPAPPGAPAEAEGYETIGQFYDAIEDGLRHLCDRLGERAVFSGDPARQVHAGHFRHTAGRLIAIGDLASALGALEEIVEQGEGMPGGEVWDGDRDVHHPDRDEVAHYYRFQELSVGRRYRRGDTPRSGPTGEPIGVDLAGVRPMRRNPRRADHAPGSPIRTAQEEFDHAYCAVLHLLEQAFNGSPRLLAVATGTMYGLKAQAEALMRMPDGQGTTAGPTFEYVPPEPRRWRIDDRQRIVVLPNGPYLVYGRVPLRRKRKVVSAENHALTWQTGDTLETEDTYALCRCGESIEPDLPRAVSVLEEEDGLASALWVTGGVPVERADGLPLESRNRMTLCRCGRSANRPLCDGTHRKIDFRE